jgi:hypothetical protein
MVAPPTVWEERLTGEIRHRAGLFGKMILQVQVERLSVTLHAPGAHTKRHADFRWVDARFDDWHALFGAAEKGRKPPP